MTTFDSVCFAVCQTRTLEAARGESEEQQPVEGQQPAYPTPQNWPLAPVTNEEVEVQGWRAAQRSWRDIMGDSLGSWMELVCGAPRCYPDIVYASKQYHATLSQASMEVRAVTAPIDASYSTALEKCRKPAGLF